MQGSSARILQDVILGEKDQDGLRDWLRRGV